MKYMLDTNTCIALINRKSANVLGKIKACSAGEVGISSITLAELNFGASKSQSPAQAHQALDQFLLPYEIADFDFLAAQQYGMIRASLEKTGTPIGPLDTLIAAQAHGLGVTLVSNNTREFCRVRNLQLEDWL